MSGRSFGLQHRADGPLNSRRVRRTPCVESLEDRRLLASIDYLTYLGGSGTDNVPGLAVDESGSAYVAGRTWGTDFPVTLDGQVETGGIWALKIAPKKAGTTLESEVPWTRFLGWEAHVQDVVMVYDPADPAAGIYLTGFADIGKIDFDSIVPNYRHFGENDGTQTLDNADVFVIKLDLDGQPLYATTIGGSAKDRAFGAAVDGMGNVVVAGWTASTDFPSAVDMNGKVLAPVTIGGKSDALVVKLDHQGSLLYAAALGGADYDNARDITLHEGQIFITGNTSSGVYEQPVDVLHDYSNRVDGFVARLNDADGSPHWDFITHLGGNGNDDGYGIIADDGALYVTGVTRSSDFWPNPDNVPKAGGDDAFVAKFDFDGTPLSTALLGGKGNDLGESIALAPSGEVVISGESKSTDFPTLNAIDDTHNGQEDVFVSILDSELKTLQFSTYLGGSAREAPQSLAVATDGSIYVSGWTFSNDLLSSNETWTDSLGFDQEPSGLEEGFLFKLNTNRDNDSPTMHVSDLDGSSIPSDRGKWNATVTITVHDATSNFVASATVSGIWSDGGSGSGSCATNEVGRCDIIRNNISKNNGSVTFTVTDVTHATNTYNPSANDDPDGDSDGTMIEIQKPASASTSPVQFVQRTVSDAEKHRSYSASNRSIQSVPTDLGEGFSGDQSLDGEAVDATLAGFIRSTGDPVDEDDETDLMAAVDELLGDSA